MKNLIIIILKTLHLYFTTWLKKVDNQILLFNVVLISLPLLLIKMCTLQTGIITFGAWFVGIIISVIFWRIRIDNIII